MSRITGILFWACLLSIQGCWRPKLEEDPTQRKQALYQAERYAQGLIQKDLSQIIPQSNFPYWLDGTVVKDAPQLYDIFAEELDQLQNWQLEKARFYTTQDLAFFNPRILSKLSENGFQNLFFVVLRFNNPSPTPRQETLVLLLEYSQERWKIRGLED